MSNPKVTHTIPENESVSRAIRNTEFPPGPARQTLAAIQSLTSGYHPTRVRESMMDGAKFEEWFALLPADLTGVDLSPLYDLAETGTQISALEKRERAWQPDPDNLGEEYNGPIGKDGRPHHRNAEKWARASVAKEMAHRNRFAVDIEQMEDGNAPPQLKQAARALVALALEPYEREWDDCADGDAVASVGAALRLCLAALCEIEVSASMQKRQVVAYHLSQLEVCGVTEGGAE